MSDKTAILENKLDTTLSILLELEFMKRGLVDVSDQNSKYFANSSRQSQFLYTVFKAFSKLLLIEIYKLIDTKSDYCLSNTIEFCQVNKDSIDWNSIPEINTFDNLKKMLEVDEGVLTNIKILRDKFYAHSDKNRFNYILKLEQVELWKLLKNLQYVFRIICQHFNGKSWIFPIQYKGTPELRMISNYVDIKRLVLHSKVEGQADNLIIGLEKILKN